MKTILYTILIRWYVANDKRLPAWLERACEGNSKLLAEWELENELSDELKKPFQEVESPDMTNRILAAIREEELRSAEPEPQRGLRWSIPLYAVGAAACMALVAVFQFDLSEEPELAQSEVVEENLDASALAEVLLEAPENWENPLDREVENVIADARGAVGFLASNFLPKNIAEELMASESDA